MPGRVINTISRLIFFKALILGISIWGLATEKANAATDPADICKDAAKLAASELGVPLPVLAAVARSGAEAASRGGLQPWPWTVTLEGRSIWFDTKAQALRYVFRHFKTGQRRFEIGCFQIQYEEHGGAFTSIEEMFDPLANARYVAEFLKQQNAQKGDWFKAVGIYRPQNSSSSTSHLAQAGRLQKAATLSTKKRRSRLPQVTDDRSKDSRLRMGGTRAGAGSLIPDRSGPNIRFLSRNGS